MRLWLHERTSHFLGENVGTVEKASLFKTSGSLIAGLPRLNAYYHDIISPKDCSFPLGFYPNSWFEALIHTCLESFDGFENYYRFVIGLGKNYF